MLENFTERVNFAFGLSFGLVAGHFMATHEWDFAVGGLIVAVSTFVTANVTLQASKAEADTARELAEKVEFSEKRAVINQVFNATTRTIDIIVGGLPLPGHRLYAKDLREANIVSNEINSAYNAALDTLPKGCIIKLSKIMRSYEKMCAEKRELSKAEEEAFIQASDQVFSWARACIDLQRMLAFKL